MENKNINMKRSILSVAIALCLVFSISAQTPPKQVKPEETTPVQAPSSNTLTNQFNYLKDKSNTYEEYKVIKITTLNQFWKNINDSLYVVKSKYKNSLKEIERQNSEIKNFKQEVDKRDKNLASGEYEKAHINVLGIDFKKESYIYLSWAIIGGLILVILIGYFRYNSSQRIASNKTKDFDALNSELNDFKQKSREKELKMGRELQTERNKVEELNQKIVSLKKQVHL
jgi:peptidoglycan hydrolase CwlO-like protein